MWLFATLLLLLVMKRRRLLMLTMMMTVGMVMRRGVMAMRISVLMMVMVMGMGMWQLMSVMVNATTPNPVNSASIPRVCQSHAPDYDKRQTTSPVLSFAPTFSVLPAVWHCFSPPVVPPIVL
jgi:hypothetical protein